MIKQHKQLHLQKFNKGFTLIELLIVIAITGIISVLFFGFVTDSFKRQDFISEQTAAIAEAQDGVVLFNKELREAANADDGAYPLELADEQEIIFYSDIDADSDTEKIRYFIEDEMLKRGTIEPSGDPIEYTADEEVSTISANINNHDETIFIYYNEDYPIDVINNPLTYPADVSEVTMAQIHLEINSDPDNIPETYELDSYVQIRNFKDNL